jgi:hypothetical protein
VGKVTTFSIGDIVRNAMTGEEGRIVRIANVANLFPGRRGYPRKGNAFIVALLAGPFVPAREALWLQSELKSDGPE